MGLSLRSWARKKKNPKKSFLQAAGQEGMLEQIKKKKKNFNVQKFNGEVWPLISWEQL